MSAPSLKDIKKLAATCRKAGITSFKFHSDGSYEFNLDPNPTVKTRQRGKKQDAASPQQATFTADVGEDILTEEQLLFWSSDTPLKITESNS